MPTISLRESAQKALIRRRRFDHSFASKRLQTISCEYLTAWLDERLSDMPGSRPSSRRNHNRPDGQETPFNEQLLSPPRVERIEPIEHGRPPSIVGVALGELAARGRAVALIPAARTEVVAATRARNAARKRAHAFWDGIDGFLRQRGGGRQRHAHAATT